MKKLILLIIIANTYLSNAQSKIHSIKFDGINDYVEIPDHNSLDFNQGNFTIFGWAKFKILSEASFFDHYISSNPDRCNFRLNASKQLQLVLKDNNSNVLVATSNISISDTNWHFYAVTFKYNSKTVNLYLDGSSIPLTYPASNLTTGINPDGSLRIAKYGNPYFSEGSIHYLTAWNIALDSTQIQKYMSCPPIGNEAGLVGYWDFEEGTGTTINDQTIYSNDGSLQGGGLWVSDIPSYNCENTSVIEFDKSKINLYPNPTSSSITISLTENINGQVFLTDLKGRVVMTKNINSNKTLMNLESIESKGMYFVKVIDNSGKIVVTKKVIFQ